MQKAIKLVPFKIVEAPNGDAWVEVRGKKMAPPGNFGAGAHEDEEDRRGLSRRAGHRSGDHGARLLQRFAAPGDQGRRPHRGARRQAHHQRADRGRARVRPRQAGKKGPQDRRLRPGRRHLRHFHHRDRGSRRRAPVRGAFDQRRHVPRRRGLRPAPDGLPVRRVQEGVGHRSAQGHARAAAAQGRGGESQDRALLLAADRDQSAVHHGRPVRAQAPRDQDHARQIRKPRRGSDRADDRALPHRDQGCRHQARRHRRRDPGRRPDAHAESAGQGEGVLRQGAAQGREPGRSGGGRRGDPGRRAARATSRTCCCST